jgi:hypothetical protein
VIDGVAGLVLGRVLGRVVDGKFGRELGLEMDGLDLSGSDDVPGRLSPPMDGRLLLDGREGLGLETDPIEGRDEGCEMFGRELGRDIADRDPPNDAWPPPPRAPPPPPPRPRWAQHGSLIVSAASPQRNRIVRTNGYRFVIATILYTKCRWTVHSDGSGG